MYLRYERQQNSGVSHSGSCCTTGSFIFKPGLSNISSFTKIAYKNQKRINLKLVNI